MVQAVYIELIVLIPVSIFTALLGVTVSEIYARIQIDQVNASGTVKLPFCNVHLSVNNIMALNWGIFGFSIVSEMFMIYVFLSNHNYLPIGLVILLTRLTNPLVALRIMTKAFNHKKVNNEKDVSVQKDIEMVTLIEPDHIFHLEPFNDRMLSVFLIAAAFYEISMLSYLPWQRKDLYLDNVSLIQFSKLFHALVGTVSPTVWMVYSVQSEVASSIAIVALSLTVSILILAYRLSHIIKP